MITALSACQGCNVQESTALNLSLQAAGMWLYQFTSSFYLTSSTLPSLELMSLSRNISLPEAQSHPVQQELQHPGFITLTPCSFRGLSQNCPCSATARQGWLVHQASHIILTLVKKKG